MQADVVEPIITFPSQHYRVKLTDLYPRALLAFGCSLHALFKAMGGLGKRCPTCLQLLGGI